MPNDAKLGLLVGVALTLGVAVLFFQKEPGPPAARIAQPAPVAKSPAARPSSLPTPRSNEVPAVPVSRGEDSR